MHTSMWSLFYLPDQLFTQNPKCSLTQQDLFTLECCDVVLSKNNTLGIKCSAAAFDTETRLSLIACGDVRDGGTEDVNLLLPRT